MTLPDAYRALVTTPGLPRIRYAALHRTDRQFGLNQNVAQLALHRITGMRNHH